MLSRTAPCSIFIHFFMANSTLKAMATAEALSSRHIAATLHLSLIRFVNSLDEVPYFLFEYTFLLHTLPCFMGHDQWDNCFLWDTVINSFMPFFIAFVHLCIWIVFHGLGSNAYFYSIVEWETVFSYQHELWIESSKISLNYQ